MTISNSEAFPLEGHLPEDPLSGFRPLTGKPLGLGTPWSQCVALRTRFDSHLPVTRVSSLDTVQTKKVYGLKTQGTVKAP